MGAEDIEIWTDGFVKDGSLVSYNPDLHKKVLKMYEGKRVEYCIRIKKRKPSKEMHAYIRKVLYPIASSAEVFGGWSQDKIIKHFKKEHLGDEKISLSDVTFEQMHAYIENIINELAGHGITVPEKPLIVPEL